MTAQKVLGGKGVGTWDYKVTVNSHSLLACMFPSRVEAAAKNLREFDVSYVKSFLSVDSALVDQGALKPHNINKYCAF